MAFLQKTTSATIFKPDVLGKKERSLSFGNGASFKVDLLKQSPESGQPFDDNDMGLRRWKCQVPRHWDSAGGIQRLCQEQG